MTIEADVARCAEQVRRFDRDRYLTALFAPADRRPALWALYAFNLEVARIRESVREPLAGAIRLQWWREAVDAAYRGAPPAAPTTQALAQAIARHDLTRKTVERLIEGREREFSDAPPANLAELETYAEATSGTLILLALEALGVRDETARETARHVGIASALAGIMRAAPYRAASGNLDFPASLMREAGIASGRIDPLRPPSALPSVVQVIVATARDHLQKARSARDRVARAALPALLSAVLADADLAALARTHYDAFAQRRGAGRVGRPLRLAWAAWRGLY
jgi:phytoene synthase